MQNSSDDEILEQLRRANEKLKSWLTPGEWTGKRRWDQFTLQRPVTGPLWVNRTVLSWSCWTPESGWFFRGLSLCLCLLLKARIRMNPLSCLIVARFHWQQHHFKIFSWSHFLHLMTYISWLPFCSSWSWVWWHWRLIKLCLLRLCLYIYRNRQQCDTCIFIYKNVTLYILTYSVREKSPDSQCESQCRY